MSYKKLFLFAFLLFSFHLKAQITATVTTVAGNGTGGFSGDGGSATSAMLYVPWDVAIDASGNMYIADEANQRIRKVSPSGIITTIAGNGTPGFSGDGGPATAAELYAPEAVKLDGAGNIYVTEITNGRIRKINGTSGIITTIAGNGSGISNPYINGLPATSVSIAPYGLAVDNLGNCFFFSSISEPVAGGATSSGYALCKVDATTGIITKIVDSAGISGFSGDGGLAVNAELNFGPSSSAGNIGIDAFGNLYIGDADNGRIRKVNASTGIITTFGGGGTGSDGSPATAASLGNPLNIALDNTGDVYFDNGGTSFGKINTLNIYYSYGSLCTSASPSGSSFGIAADNSGNIYYATWDGQTINKLTPTSTVTTGTTTLCVGADVTLSNAISGGTWSSSYPGIATVGSASGLVTGASAGVTAIMYTSCYGTVYTNITVNPLAIAGTITGTVTVCAGAAATLSNATTGGLWSSGSISIATVGSTGIVSGIASGTSTISYSVTNGCGTATATQIITVNPLPSAGGISGTATVCTGAVTMLGDATTGGLWSSAATGIATVGSTGTVNGVTGGTAVISYSLTTGCGTATATKIVTVSPLPIAGTITGTAIVCAGATMVLSNVTTGGVWSNGASSIATVSSIGTVGGVAGGTATISYSVINDCGTAVTTKIVTVNPLPSPGTVTGASTICISSTTALTDATTGGTWSSSATGIATVGTTGIVAGVSPGTSIISYSVTNGCGTAAATSTITVNSFPTAGTITGTVTVCVSSATTLSDAATGGVWSSTATGIATVGSTGIVAGITGGTATISYSVTNGCGTTAAASTVTINPLPTVGIITGTSIVCAGATTTLSDAITGGVWSSSATGIATAGSAGVVTGVSAGTAAVTYTVTNGCGSVSAAIIITVNTSPVAGIITGAASACSGGTISLSDAISGGTWNSGSTAIATITGTGILTGISSGTVTITYIVTNTCGTAPAYTVVTVNPSPAAGTITGTGTVCAGITTVLSDAISGGLWSSGATGIATVGVTGIVTGISAGTAIVTYSVSNSCGAAAATETVTVNVAPASAGTIAGSDTVCVGNTVALSDGSGGGAWSSNISIATVSATGLVTGVSAGADIITYTVTNTCGSINTTLPIIVLSTTECNEFVLNSVSSPVDLQVYPNPNEGAFTMKLISVIDEEVLVTITNVVGEKVKELTARTNRVVNIKLIKPGGIYFLSATTAHGKYVKKIIVE